MIITLAGAGTELTHTVFYLELSDDFFIAICLKEFKVSVMKTYRHPGIAPIQGGCIDVCHANSHIIKLAVSGVHQAPGYEMSAVCVDLVTLSPYKDLPCDCLVSSVKGLLLIFHHTIILPDCLELGSIFSR